MMPLSRPRSIPEARPLIAWLRYSWPLNSHLNPTDDIGKDMTIATQVSISLIGTRWKFIKGNALCCFMAQILAEKTNPGASERRKGLHGMCLFQCSLLDTLKGHFLEI